MTLDEEQYNGLLRMTKAWSIKLLCQTVIFVPGASSHILSPQHWLQTAKDNKPNPRGTWCATYDDKIVMWWNQRKYKQSCPIDPNETNVATIMTAPSYN